MPSPVGHALIGGLIYLSQYQKIEREKYYILIFTLIFAVLPDIDFLFGFFIGNPNACHHQFTHSFTFVIFTGFVGAWALSKRSVLKFRFYSVLFIFAGCSHILADLVALDNSFPYGLQIFWPFTKNYYIAPFHIFSDITRRSDSRQFFFSLFNKHNLEAVGIEVLICLPLLGLLLFYLKRNKRLF